MRIVVSSTGLLVMAFCFAADENHGAAVAAFGLMPTTTKAKAKAKATQTPSSSSSSSSTGVASAAVQSRRGMLQDLIGFGIGMTTTTAAAAFAATTLYPTPAVASGGATAGKYTTIPIAKRRYYGRVQAAVHDFLLIGPDMLKADMSAEMVKGFFDPEGLVVVEGKRQDINGQCTKKDGNCRGKEIRDSRYNDMKTSMYLLGNAFRLNQTKAPDNLPTVRAAKKFFKEMDLVEKAAKKGKKADTDAVRHYAAALDALDEYLDLVELPPTDSGWYDKEFSRAVGDSARIT